ncbi:MAG: NUDIX domain-containing protein [Planctomycetota bacterium]|nr:NUDIX domain-containing protein [Planctomycetota bacterium]
MPEFRSCGFLILRNPEQPEFLLMKHRDRWDLPKGHVEAGESDFDCAFRELHEETGICEDSIDLEPEYSYESHYTVRPKWLNGGAARKTTVIFLAWLREEVAIEVTEHEGFEWFPWNPPHAIQRIAIDPLLADVAKFLDGRSEAAE